jgi:hypothetical protein
MASALFSMSGVLLWQDDQHAADHGAQFLHFLTLNSLSPLPSSAPIDCTTPIHCTQTFMDVHHTFVFVNQDFNYSSLLETGIYNRRHFKILLQPHNLPE